MNRESQEAKDLSHEPFTSARSRKLEIHEDTGMVAYIMEALKSKLHGFKGQERASKLFSIVQLARINQGNKLEEKMTKCLKETTLPPMVAQGPIVASKLLPAPSLEDITKCRGYFLFFDSIDIRCSSLCNWSFEALVPSRFLLSN
ncbi:hypothetical protein M9H77_22678 [Catharanthus roseus]|uniref:Uncharacterized protein n=1 Tax=Catharanthus roseus TaxID=4058 RepID=A0ACC0AR50_CATRO|nr:hypothetical protein M9H77_22678 [Catharanthus roseus]